MHLRTHLWTSALTALICYPRAPRQAALLALAGVLIDIDHLILYYFQTGDYSIIGALRYDRYRNRPVTPGDTRPRYGPLRSWLHQPALLLPPIWLLVWRWPALRPVALGVTLHLALDTADFLRHWPICARKPGPHNLS